jgi:hypothetical protein
MLYIRIEHPGKNRAAYARVVGPTNFHLRKRGKMPFLDILTIFTVLAASIGSVRFIQYWRQTRLWRREKRNFRTLYAADVAQFALPKAVALTTFVWLAIACPVLSLALAGGAAGYAFQRKFDL